MKKMFQSTFILTVFVFSFVSAAWGAPCLPGTLTGYIGLGSAGCTNGGVLLSDFTVLSVPIGATPIPPGDVAVTPLNDINGPGLQFAVNQNAGSGEFFDVKFGYNVSNNTFSGVTLFMTGSSATGDGAVTTIEEIWLGAPFDPFYINPESETLIVFDIGIDSDAFEQLTFTPVTSIGVIKDIGIDGGLGGTGQLVSATNQFTVETPAAIPEPATILLVATGLGYLSIRRRRTT